MKEHANKWKPVTDMDFPFESISYAFKDDSLSIHMIGKRTLALDFSEVIAFRFEQECPGVDFPALPLPMLREAATFPLLVIEGSNWLEHFKSIYKGRSHFALISSDHLAQVIALSNVKARWE